MDTEGEAEALVILLGTLMYEGELAGRHVYTGPISEDGVLWHEADQRTQVEVGMSYLKARIAERGITVYDG